MIVLTGLHHQGEGTFINSKKLNDVVYFNTRRNM